jgi:hypothetical protein
MIVNTIAKMIEDVLIAFFFIIVSPFIDLLQECKSSMFIGFSWPTKSGLASDISRPFAIQWLI